MISYFFLFLFLFLFVCLFVFRGKQDLIGRKKTAGRACDDEDHLEANLPPICVPHDFRQEECPKLRAIADRPMKLHCL